MQNSKGKSKPLTDAEKRYEAAKIKKPNAKEQPEQLEFPIGYEHEVEEEESRFWDFDENPTFEGVMEGSVGIKFKNDEAPTTVYLAKDNEGIIWKMPTNWKLTNRLSQVPKGTEFCAILDGEVQDGAKRIKQFRVATK